MSLKDLTPSDCEQNYCNLDDTIHIKTRSGNTILMSLSGLKRKKLSSFEFKKYVYEYADRERRRINVLEVEDRNVDITLGPIFENPAWSSFMLSLFYRGEMLEAIMGDLLEEKNSIITPKVGKKLAKIWYVWHVFLLIIRKIWCAILVPPVFSLIKYITEKLTP